MRNPVLPYGLIAVLGLITMIIISFVGVEQRAALSDPDNGNAEVELSLDDAEDIYQNKCANCHGDDLSGSDTMPNLSQIGNKLSREEIVDIIINGKGQMPGGLATPEEAEILGQWLEEKK